MAHIARSKVTIYRNVYVKKGSTRESIGQGIYLSLEQAIDMGKRRKNDHETYAYTISFEVEKHRA